MNKTYKTGSGFLLLLQFAFIISLEAQTGRSVYPGRLYDPEAVCFEYYNNGKVSGGIIDVTAQLQNEINRLKAANDGGIVFIPEGTYLITGTVYIPDAIRLIGYGKKRPLFILEQSSPDFSMRGTDEKSRANYMFCFTGSAGYNGFNAGSDFSDSYYSAFSNIDLRIGEGNPRAIGIWTGTTLQGFVSNCDIYAGSGMAGIEGSGTGIENVRIYGGEYGIMTGASSADRTLLVVDTYFESQRKSAIQSGNTGIIAVGMHVKDVPEVIYIKEGSPVRLFMENCFFDNVYNTAMMAGIEETSLNQINLKNIQCRNVPVIVCYPSGKKVCVSGEYYSINDFVYGQTMSDLSSPSSYGIENDIVPLKKTVAPVTPEIPVATVTPGWANIRNMGAAGDGHTDDTEAFRKAIADYDNIYVPQGIYRISGTLKLRPGTRMVGLHPFYTRLELTDSSPEFSGFGPPKAIIETAAGGNAVLSGIGIGTGDYNYRAAGCIWMAGEGSLMKDVVFTGNPYINTEVPLIKTSPVKDTGFISWQPAAEISGTGQYEDNKYWSLWITNNGGGVFKDIRSSDTGASSGLYISNTVTPGNIYGMSLKCHIHNEARISRVSNWKIYALGMESQGDIGNGCQPLEVSSGKNITFAGADIRKKTSGMPGMSGIRLWDSDNITFLNIHNAGRDQFTPEFPVYDINRRMALLSKEMARLTVTGLEKGDNQATPQIPWVVHKLITSLEFTRGITSDSKGNIYFCETGTKKIYKWSSETGSVTILAQYHWYPLSLACDKNDNLIVVFRYYPQPGYIVNGKQETIPDLPDSDHAYTGNLNRGWAAMAFSVSPDDPDGTIELLPRVSTGELKNIKNYLYPSGRLRYNFDTAAVYLPATSFIARDRITAIPETYDLGGSPSLSSAVPGRQLYISDAALKRTVRLQVDETGRLNGMIDFAGKGEFSSAVDPEGNVYIADGVIYIFGVDGSEKGTIKLDERPVSLCFGGEDKRILFIATASSVYCLRTEPL